MGALSQKCMVPISTPNEDQIRHRVAFAMTRELFQTYGRLASILAVNVINSKTKKITK